jgi:hypothetical protein
MTSVERTIKYKDWAACVLVRCRSLNRPVEHNLLLYSGYTAGQAKGFGIPEGTPVSVDPKTREMFVDCPDRGKRYYLSIPRRGLTDNWHAWVMGRWEEEVPQPKVRGAADVRWRYGRWERLTKKRGWVPCG